MCHQSDRPFIVGGASAPRVAEPQMNAEDNPARPRRWHRLSSLCSRALKNFSVCDLVLGAWSLPAVAAQRRRRVAMGPRLFRRGDYSAEVHIIQEVRLALQWGHA